MKQQKEAEIMIGSTQLSLGQSMSVRVAVAGMLMQLDSPKYRKELGEIANGYRCRLSEVQKLIFANVRLSEVISAVKNN